jgi:hypothetical protein
MTWLRWAAVIPAAFFGFYAALAFGFGILHVLDGLCPPDQIESGFCIAPWYEPALQSAVCFCSGLAAFLVVLLPTLAAPNHKRLVAGLSYVSGAGTAIAMAAGHRVYSITDLAPVACAILTGLVAAGLIWRFTRGPRVVV